ncbi:MAG: bifunctional 3-deoxy-7-phosphoheptulonate synthase/chorismate mutase [Bacteroidetes bacterium]|nr:bifunctional 3-deoxy-7-phosphoheptulonate synthase/chorismate mutase [Bacteroidota bacterium]
MKNIEILRNKVNKINEDIVNLLIERKTITDELIQEKIDNHLPVLDTKRENEIIEYFIEHKKELNPAFIKKIFNLIFEEAKRRYYKLEQLDSIEAYLKRKPILIAGPCVVESLEQISNIANLLSKYGIKFLRGGAFKPRTSPNSFQGLGDLGVELLYKAARANNMFTVTEVLESEQLERNYDFIDVVQIGARSMTSYGLLKSVGYLTAKTKKVVLLKRGLSATLSEFLQAAEYILQAGNPNVVLCLRGIRTFEQIDSNLRFTPDLASILELKEKTGLPVIFDPSHSGGCSDYVINISNAALQLGADGLMVETHDRPLESKVDAHQAIHPDKILDIINL